LVPSLRQVVVTAWLWKLPIASPLSLSRATTPGALPPGPVTPARPQGWP